MKSHAEVAGDGKGFSRAASEVQSHAEAAGDGEGLSRATGEMESHAETAGDRQVMQSPYTLGHAGAAGDRQVMQSPYILGHTGTAGEGEGMCGQQLMGRGMRSNDYCQAGAAGTTSLIRRNRVPHPLSANTEYHMSYPGITNILGRRAHVGKCACR